MSSPWNYYPGISQGPSPGSPNFREIFPSGLPDKVPDAEPKEAAAVERPETKNRKKRC